MGTSTERLHGTNSGTHEKLFKDLYGPQNEIFSLKFPTAPRSEHLSSN